MSSPRILDPIRVALRLWGCTQEDVKRAEANARQYYFARSWNIVEVIPSTGVPCPIPIRDPIALNQNALYDAAWAAYPAGRHRQPERRTPARTRSAPEDPAAQAGAGEPSGTVQNQIKHPVTFEKVDKS